MSSALDTNPVIQTLGLEFDAPYVKETFLFFYCVQVVQNLPKTKNCVHMFAVALMRAFGSYGFLLPMILGGLPSKTYQNFDSYLLTLIGAIVVNEVVISRIPNATMKFLQYPIEVMYCVVKANAAGHGFVMVAGALPDSIAAPFVGAYFAVNGHRILENGISSFSGNNYDGDSFLGVAGGFFYYALIEYVRVSSLVARVFLIIFRVSCDYVDYNQILDHVMDAVGNVGSGSTPMSRRGRSKTPKRK